MARCCALRRVAIPPRAFRPGVPCHISMKSVPADQRGVASGMRATFQNGASVMSIGVFFSIVTIGLSIALPGALSGGLIHAGVPHGVSNQIAHLPPTAALFAAFLGYNPMATLLPGAVLHTLPAANQVHLLSKSFFPDLISSPFMLGLHIVFYLSVVMCVIAAIASLLRGNRDIYDEPASIGATQTIAATNNSTL